jgi:hypothetical protein
VRLYLLDADVDGNPDDLRTVTDRVYGGDTEHRLRQEILLGVGGVRALQALGIDAQGFHTNDGHAGFLGFERIRPAGRRRRARFRRGRRGRAGRHRVHDAHAYHLRQSRPDPASGMIAITTPRVSGEPGELHDGAP